MKSIGPVVGSAHLKIWDGWDERKEMLTLFSLPGDALASTTAYIGGMVTDVGVFIWLGIGIPLAFYVIKKVMAILPKR